MNIWHNIPLYVDPADVPAAAKSPGQSPIGQMFTWNLPVLTRSRKIEEMRVALDNHLGSPYRAADMPLGLYLGGSGNKVDGIIRGWVSQSRHSDKLSCLIREFADIDKAPDEDDSRREVNSKLHVFLGEKLDPRSFESLFYTLSRNSVQGIAINVEFVQRAVITLAQRFSLNTIVTGVVHERHEAIALKSGADSVLVH